ncbi:helix-turn-helix domain-containing protein [Streptomyces sp. NPDC088748]|uniref:helix-turn-helix domain-containing protein n=1 Tax=Streptomyces sp. NPDC088748 TaxID=3365887 RepID=UPI0037F2895B
MTRSELLSLPASVDIVTAGRALGVGRTTAYALARSGEFPVAVIRAGKAYRVVTADLLRVLHITPENTNGVVVAPTTPSSEHVTQTA